MLVLVLFAFVAGVLSILAPCTLPVVPLVLGAGAGGGGRNRPVGLVIGLALSFIAVTIVLASILAAMGISTSGLRLLAVVALGTVGLTLVWPLLGRHLEAAFRPLVRPGMRLATGQTAMLGSPTHRGGDDRAGGLWSGLAMGAAIGLVWAPCVGPIMAGTIAVAATRGPTLEAAVIAFAYVGGAAIPLLAVARWGRAIANRPGGFFSGQTMRRSFGAVTVAAALIIATGFDVRIQSAVTDALPAGWSAALYSVEKQPAIQQELNTLNDKPNTVLQPSDVALADYGPAPELAGITTWINSEPLTISALRGRVVLVHFWTFGCINCRNVQPYVKAWYERYAPTGFEVIGVHTPELSFEKDIANVRQAVIDEGVKFPVAFDPDYLTWNAYANSYWPASYFIDRSGRIRHVQFGEGGYAEQEQVIRELLDEPAPTAMGSSLAAR